MSGTIGERRRAEVMALAEQSGGTISPAAVVALAANPATALHSLFTWDDTLAAQRWREDQASQYLRAVVTLLPGTGGAPVPVRAFVSLSVDRGPEHVYRAIEQVLDDGTRRSVLLADATRELIALKKKYATLSELSDVWAQLDAVMSVAVVKVA